jgi:riboflavin kinase/FMN adenylyltransferase
LKVYHNLDEFKPLKQAIATVGTFDGVHIGHQKLLKRIQELADKEGGETVLLTFHPHPRLVLFPDDNDLKLITTLEERIDRLSQTGLNHLITHPFTTEFSRTTAIEYVRDILVEQIGVKKLVIGYDHHFGRNREGSLENLKELAPTYGFNVEEIPAQEIKDVNVSSTKIRNALNEGDVKNANSFLGYHFQLSGTVVKGSEIGSSLGFPTANVEVDNPNKIIPAPGVYATQALINGREYKSMTNLGFRPTVHENSQLTVEAHLFNFDKDIYGETITLRFIDRIREEVKFDNRELLKDQIAKDAGIVQKVLADWANTHQ